MSGLEHHIISMSREYSISQSGLVVIGHFNFYACMICLQSLSSTESNPDLGVIYHVIAFAPPLPANMFLAQSSVYVVAQLLIKTYAEKKKE